MSNEVADLYVSLRLNDAHLVDGFIADGKAGDRMAVQVAAAMKEVTASVDRVAVAMQKTTVAADEMALKASMDMQRLALATSEASAKMQAAEAKAAASTNALGDALQGAGAKSRVSAKDLGIIAAVATGIGIVTIKMAADFESSTTKLVTSAGELHSNLELVRKGLLEMAGDVGYSATHLADAMYTIDGAGFHGAESLLIMKSAAQAAKAENADLANVTDAVTTTLVDYHLGADRAADVTSKLLTAVGLGKSNFSDFAGALHSVVPLASAVHISIEEVTGALAAMTVHGMSADQASQNLADAIRHLESPIQSQIKAMGQINVSAQDVSHSLGEKGLSGTIEYLTEKITAKMGPSGQVLFETFNKSKSAAEDANIMISHMPGSLQALAKQFQAGALSSQEWTKALKSLPVDQANLARQFATVENRARGFSDQLKSGSPAALEYTGALQKIMGDSTGLNVALMLSGDNMGTFKNNVKTIGAASKETGGNVKGWTEVQGTFNQKLSEAKSGLGALGIEIGQRLLPFATKLFSGLADGAQWLSKHRFLAEGLAIALGVLATAFTLAAIATWAENSALLANPVTWIILAVVAVVAILVIAIYELVTHWSKIWKWIKGIALDVWHWLVDAWQWVWGKIMDAWHWAQKNVFEPIGHFIQTNFIHPFMVAVHFIAGLFHTWWVTIRTIVLFVHGFLKTVFMSIGKAIGDAIAPYLHWIKARWDDMWNGIHIVTNWAKEKLHQFFGWVKDHAITPTVDAFHWLGRKWDDIWNGIKIMANWVWENALKPFFGWIKTHGIDPVHDAIHWLGKKWDDIWNGIKAVAKSAWDWLEPIFNKIKKAIDTISSGLKIIKDSPGKAGEEVAHMLGFADGGPVPGAPGEPMLAIVHGGEFVLSRDMLSGLRPASPLAAAAVTTQSGGGSGGQLFAEIVIDGKKVFSAIVPYAQRYKGRNTASALV